MIRRVVGFSLWVIGFILLAVLILGMPLVAFWNDPQGLIGSVITTISVLILAVAIEYFAAKLIPDPINAWFFPAFIVASFFFAKGSFDLYNLWVAW